MVAYNNKFAGRDRRVLSGSSSPDDSLSNSGCRRRSPRSLEFCADLWRIPSILYVKRPRSIRTEFLDRLDLSRWKLLRGPPMSSESLTPFRGRIRSAGQAETGILPEVLRRSWSPPATQPRGGVLLLFLPSGTASFYSMSCCWGLRIRWWWGEFDLRRHFLGHATLSFSWCSSPRRFSGSPRDTKLDRQPFRHFRVPLDSQNDMIIKKKCNN